MSETKIFHFSVDDTIECFKDINTNNYNTIFQNPTFAWFKDAHGQKTFMRNLALLFRVMFTIRTASLHYQTVPIDIEMNLPQMKSGFGLDFIH